MGFEHASDEMDALSRTAARLRPWLVRGKPLPNLLFFTDPARTPDPERVAERLPASAAVVFRAFGAADAVVQGRRLREISRRRGLVLLVGAEPALALAVEADGLHLPERLASTLPDLRQTHPGWLITIAAHDEAAARAGAASGADALVVSPVFPSASPSAGASAVSTSRPAPRYARRNASRMAGSSSTTRSVGITSSKFKIQNKKSQGNKKSQ